MIDISFWSNQYFSTKGVAFISIKKNAVVAVYCHGFSGRYGADRTSALKPRQFLRLRLRIEGATDFVVKHTQDINAYSIDI